MHPLEEIVAALVCVCVCKAGCVKWGRTAFWRVLHSWKLKPQKNIRIIRENEHELAQAKDR
jgi:hypothetical protein